LKKKLKRDETDSEQLIQIKLLLSACLNFYIDKYKPFNNVFLIAATFLDPWTKDFEFSRNLCDTKPYELIEKAKHFLIKRDKEINPHTTKKNSNEKKEHSIRKKDKVDSVEDEFNSFCGRAKDVAEEFDISTTNLEREIEFYEAFKLKIEMHRSEFWRKNELKMPRLSRLVRSVCCGPPSTVGDESIFSVGKDIVTAKRNRLSDYKLEVLTFLKKNLAKEFLFLAFVSSV
jgi:hypothetical protein